MKPEQYQKLVNQHGEKGAMRIIEILDNYKVSSQHVYYDDYRAALGWPTKEYMKELAQQEWEAKRNAPKTQSLVDKWRNA